MNCRLSFGWIDNIGIGNYRFRDQRFIPGLEERTPLRNVTDYRRRGFAKSGKAGVGSQAFRDVRIGRLVSVVGSFRPRSRPRRLVGPNDLGRINPPDE